MYRVSSYKTAASTKLAEGKYIQGERVTQAAAIQRQQQYRYIIHTEEAASESSSIKRQR
jgi:hypothetical protein